MKKISFIGAFILGLIIAQTTGVEAATLPSPVDGKITLSENITLDTKYENPADTTITLDLNGFTLTGPTTNYAIDNKGVLNIEDNKGTGSIVCPASTLSYDSSCIRNYKNMTINGVTINANWTAVKNEEGSTVDINNSTITSEKNTAGVIMNYGTATIKSSSLKGNSTPNGTAIFALSYKDASGTTYNSTTTIEDTKLDAYKAVLAKKYDDSDTAGTRTITIKGGEISPNAEIDLRDGTSTLTIDGEVKGPISALSYFKEGSTIILNETSATIEAGTTIANNITIKVNNGTSIENKTDKDIKVVNIENNEEVVVKSGEKKEVKMIKITVLPVDNSIKENPNTSDNIINYILLLITSSITALGLIVKKLGFNK